MESTTSKINDPALRGIAEQHHAQLLCGNLFDLQVEGDSIAYRPIWLAEQLHNQGKIVLRYSRSGGLSIHRQGEITGAQKTALDELLTRTGIAPLLGRKSIDPTEVILVFRGIKALATNKGTVQFAFIIDYADHLSQHPNGSPEAQIVAEAINDIATLPAAQKAGHVLLVLAPDESGLSPLLKNLYRVNYGYPQTDDYTGLLTALAKKDEYARLDMPHEAAARLSKGLNLSQLAALCKAAKVQGRKVSADDLLQEKERLIVQVSEGTLTVLPTRLTFDDMAGLPALKGILSGFAAKLRRHDPTSPRCILLAGPPGQGKSTIVGAFANAAGFNLLELSDSIKSQWVGQSERNLDLAFSLIESLAPVILFIDEIDQAFGNRSNTSLDGGVSAHYLKTVFKFAAREDLRGQICIIGASNTPQLLDPAMISRFITIPMLEATPESMAAVFPKIQQRICSKQTLNPDSKELLEASQLLYHKGGSPRSITEVVSHAITQHGTDITDTNILESCRKFRTNGDPISSAYSSLSAIRLTAFEDYFPWHQQPSYPFPWYLEGVVNPASGTIDELALDAKINEFRAKSRY